MNQTVSKLLADIQQQLQLEDILSLQNVGSSDDQSRAEGLSEQQLEDKFVALRNAIAELMNNPSLSETAKADVLKQIQSTLAEFEEQALEQRQAIQQGLGKLSKSRRSVKQYQQNR